MSDITRKMSANEHGDCVTTEGILWPVKEKILRSGSTFWPRGTLENESRVRCAGGLLGW